MTQGDCFSSKTLISTGAANNPQGLMPLARTPRSRLTRGRAENHVHVPGVNVDFVQLEGRGEQQVREITLESAEATVLDVSPETQYVELKSLDGAGRELEYDMGAQQVSLENPNPFPVRIRLVLMILGAPREGVPQEAILVHDVTTVEAKASGSTVVALDAGTRRLLREHGSTSFVTLRPVLAP